MENLEQIIDGLNQRLVKYETALKSAEEEENSGKVRRYKRIITQYVTAIRNAKSGVISGIVDLPNPPGFPPLIETPYSKNSLIEENNENISESASTITEEEHIDRPIVVVEECPDENTRDINNELNLRLEKYLLALKAAEDEDSSAKVRRYKRIVSQYKIAISNFSAGRNVDLSELPNPPGFPPLVVQKSPMPSPHPSPTASPQPSPLPVRALQPSPLPGSSNRTDAGPARPAPPVPSRIVPRSEKNTVILKERQKEYRDAAINSKRAGNIEEAKEFLKICKGFDRLIQASEGGLPVDLSTIPVSLKESAKLEESFHVVSAEDFSNNSSSDVFEMIKHELTEQIRNCMVRKSNLKGNGDIANANRFEQWAQTFKKDLNRVMMLKSSMTVPKFHFEQKSFSLMQCFNDVASGVVELTVVQAVNLPKIIDSYVGYEFPYPANDPPSGYTAVVKNSSNPSFNAVLTFPIERDSKPCQRLFKRHAIKLELWSRGGLFHRDSSLGTVTIKLLPLMTDIMIHDAFDLMNGRRPAGGKLEIKVRIREPLITKKIETITEKWLILE